jgi:hypothetical protein
MYRGLGPMLLGYLPTWAVYMAVYEKSKDYFYSKMGKWATCIHLSSLVLICCRQQVACSGQCLDNSRRMLHNGNQSDMGH